tara:strand:- start:2388 stop:2510 length:123 start_codon:yes stop_codon:yes gene_type:complete
MCCTALRELALSNNLLVITDGQQSIQGRLKFLLSRAAQQH